MVASTKWTGRLRWWGRATVLVGLLAGATLVVASPAAAAVAGDQMRGQFKNLATGQCLDSNLNGAVYMLPCQEGNRWQSWEINFYGTKSNEGYDNVWLRNAHTRLCLTLYTALDLEPAAQTSDCHGYGGNQKFDGRGTSWNNVQLRVLYNGPFCVDARRSYVAGDCTFDSYQTWGLVYRY